MRDINKIIVHCSDSEWGTAEEIRKWHLERGWSDIGYHFVICNGYPTYQSYKSQEKDPNFEGLIQPGRPIEIAGAHAKGDNHDSIGVCMIGRHSFPTFKPLHVLIYQLARDFRVTPYNVLGHCETQSGISQGKTCPNFNMDKIREYLIFQLLDTYE